ncbi:MAG: cytochrome c [Saprospiraceae bacterium]|nr:cytochrome c [Saprospiraceae bacterium]
MMKKILWGGLFLFALLAFRLVESPLHPDHSVAELLETLGDKPLPHKPDMSVDGVSIERGKDIVINGWSKVGSKKSRKQSKHFTCIACHNIEREEPNLAAPNPAKRLVYAAQNKLPYLPGSPLYGIVNRTSFYNGDYIKKYGQLVDLARNDLREAIALCAVECSQGRGLKPFEMESVLAYLWTIDLKLRDLQISEKERKVIEMAFANGSRKEKAIEILKSKYLDHSPASFVDPPEDRTAGTGKKGIPENGQLLYDLSCQHCHLDHPFSYLILDGAQTTFKHLMKQASTYKAHSIYQVVRYGTSPKGGDEAYMPLYTAERMSDQQLADLRAYIKLKADHAL